MGKNKKKTKSLDHIEANIEKLKEGINTEKIKFKKQKETGKPTIDEDTTSKYMSKSSVNYY